MTDVTTAPEPLGLRERRRLQTEREIALAALALFEERGVDGTTVDDIAAAAGISGRTFFRYFGSKELAAYVPDVEIDLGIAARIEALSADRPLVPQVEALWRAVVEGLGRDEARSVLLRVRRLSLAEPSVRMAGLHRDEQRTDALVQHLLALYGPEREVEVRLVVEVSLACLRVALDTWAVAADRGREVDLVATYDTCMASLHTLTRG
ncbi:TetR family transcriptional regulator [Nocardioides bruguierae]|uniref:TetR family transcriptional regulator n=1 Tax=Nocardioides bruguierae TaxID=2945102 RepID=A0A9X2IGV1_9ACTN|nr:TetR family transcriptional regulator [Nocardioides bruguierae]MCM0622403.1 TetR family transcriptional regulator [Nocardioides bruguierae]